MEKDYRNTAFDILKKYISSGTGLLLLPISVLVVTCLLSACKENPARLEDPNKPRVETRSWSTPNPIAGVPITISPGGISLTSLSAGSDKELHLLLSIPGDSMLPAHNYSLGYMSLNNGTWIFEGTVEGAGSFWPTGSIETGSEQTLLFWSGVASEHKQEWIDSNFAFHTNIYFCLFNGGECSASGSLFKNPLSSYLLFQEISIDNNNKVNLSSYNGSFSFQHEISSSGDNINFEELGFSTQPQSVAKNDTLHLIYVRANSVFYKEFVDEEWSGAKSIEPFDEPAFMPTITVGQDGVYHVFFWTRNTEGAWSLMYVSSTNRGISWKTPISIHTRSEFFFRTPKARIDSFGVLHVAWTYACCLASDSVSTNILGYYSSFREGVWEDPEIVFPELELTSDVLMEIDSDNTVHIVTQGLDTHQKKKIYHSMYR